MKVQTSTLVLWSKSSNYICREYPPNRTVGNQKRSRLGVFLALAAIFLLAGSLGTYYFYRAARDSHYREVRQQLLVVAELSAAQIDANVCRSLTAPTQTDDPGYKNEQAKLQSIVNSSADVSHITVLKQIGPQYYFILDAASKGPEARKSLLLDPADEIPEELISAITLKNSVASRGPIDDRWGEWYSAFAPVLDVEGNVVAVVAVDRESASVAYGDQQLWLVFELGLLLVGMISLAAAWCASGPVAQGFAENRFRRLQPKSRFAIEALLCCLILALAAEAAFSIVRQGVGADLTAEQMNYQTALLRGEATLKRISEQQPLEEAKLQDLQQSLNAVKLDWQPAAGEPTAAEVRQLETQIQRIRAAQNTKLGDLAMIQESQKATNWRFIVEVLLLGLAAVAAFRNSTNQDEHVANARHESNTAQAQLSSMFENLPVGLFVIQDQEIVFANTEWHEQVSSQKTAISVLGEAIHPEDCADALRTILTSSRDAKPFSVAYRIQLEGQPTRHVETRGVPVYDNDGICRRMLGFTVDLTATVEAQQALGHAYTEVEHKNKLLSDALGELEENLESVVRALVKAVEAKDPYTAGHSERVMEYSLWLGDAIGLGPYERRILELGTLVHDVGKIGIPDAILTKPDKLTDEEYAIIKKHPEYGANIIGNIPMFQECLPIVRHHHERIDGRGYPDGLKGDELSVLVRISAIADIFDAMTSTRAYRKGMDLDKVLEIMDGCAERGEIDPQLFNTFCQVIRERGIISQTVLQEPWKAA